MDQDEKTQRPPRAAAVRSTAPAGTPYPVAPKSPPPAPAPSESQPRTVGGHTARLLIAEDDPLDFDSFPGPGPLLSDVGALHGGSAVPSPSVSATVGGTMRLATVSPDTAAVAKTEVARGEAEKRAADEPVDDGAASGPKPRSPAEPSKPTRDDGAPKAPAVLTAAISGRPSGDGGSSFLARLFAPVSVAVGLIFFAMGSMLTLTVEGRLIRFSVSIPADGPPAHAGAVGSGPTLPAAVSGAAPTGVPAPVAASGSVASTAPAPPAASTAPTAPTASMSSARSAVPPPPPGTGRPAGGKLKPLIF